MGGADDGHFAAIKVKGFPSSNSANVDALLPLDFASRPTLPRPAALNTPELPEFDKIGDDIVNSISIHKLPNEGDKADDIVAVLTNNDKTVRIYSLTRKQEVTVLDFPFPMNHATISPDGDMLVAVGDHNSGFFFERNKTKKPNLAKNMEGRVESTPPDWTLLHEVSLHVPLNSPIEGYFTTAWSPSGRYCAVGSECGYITIFSTEVLKDCEYGEDAIIKLVTSTRPDITYGAGAVRTMMFSPAPWDFLIWSEDQARVCVADLRSGVKIKQVLTLDPKDDDVEKVEIANFEYAELSPAETELRREADFIRNYRHTLTTDGTGAAATLATEYIDHAERRRLYRQLGVVESDDDPHGLTAHERSVLETLRTTRPRDQGREPGTTPRSINYGFANTGYACFASNANRADHEPGNVPSLQHQVVPLQGRGELTFSATCGSPQDDKTNSRDVRKNGQTHAVEHRSSLLILPPTPRPSYHRRLRTKHLRRHRLHWKPLQMLPPLGRLTR